MDMIERVARAIHAAEMGSDIIYDECADIARDMARAAIETMREPTDEMLVAFGMNPDEAGRYWRAMIDAALQSAS